MARVQNCPEITILTSQLSPGQGQVELGERGGWVSRGGQGGRCGWGDHLSGSSGIKFNVAVKESVTRHKEKVQCCPGS